MGKRLAVLVGCNYPSTQFRLRGCINDVVDMRQLLLERFGFDDSDVKILIDEPVPAAYSNFTTVIPTGANIKAELNWMVNQAEVGDVLFFYFSGHGTVLASLDPGHAYMEHEAIVPCDLNLITDMDLRQLISRLPKGAHFTILSVPVTVISTPTRGFTEVTGHEGILLSGCQENEISADVVGFDGKAYGAFTNALQQVLLAENRNGKISNRQLVEAVRKALKTDGFQQHACLYSSEGNADAGFLAAVTGAWVPTRESEAVKN
ncbi:hypothetical protein PTKIN_Ptkin16aG0061700 [Pterospermum kingtungense]